MPQQQGTNIVRIGLALEEDLRNSEARTASAGVTSGPGKDAVAEQLRRVLASAEFHVPERAKKFLRYIVEEALEGRADRIKAYTIALQVLDRDDTFDPQIDPVVRIEAARLRRALERYYLVAGGRDPVRIEIPKGAYVPKFTRQLPPQEPDVAATDSLLTRAGEPLPSRKWRFLLRLSTPVVALTVSGFLVLCVLALRLGIASGPAEPRMPRVFVVPFSPVELRADLQPYAAALSDELITQLARFKEVEVLGRETSRGFSAATSRERIRRDLEADYVVEGNVGATAERIRVAARLVDTASGNVLWSQVYDRDISTRDLLSVQEDIANRVASAVAQPYGIIFQSGLRSTPPKAPDDLSAYLCVLSFYSYHADPSAGAHLAGRTCLERTVTRFPKYATARAMLSYAYLDEDRYGFNPIAGAPRALQRALEAAQTATRLEPDNGRALQALMMALFFNRDVQEASRVGERAMALNPNDSEIMGEFGGRIALAGERKRGVELLKRAVSQNPGNATFYRSQLALAAYLDGDIDRATEEIRSATLGQVPLYHFIAALIYAEAGQYDEAQAARSAFVQQRPNYFNGFEDELAKRNFPPRDRERIILGAVKAGFPVPARLREEVPLRSD